MEKRGPLVSHHIILLYHLFWTKFPLSPWPLDLAHGRHMLSLPLRICWRSWHQLSSSKMEKQTIFMPTPSMSALQKPHGNLKPSDTAASTHCFSKDVNSALVRRYGFPLLTLCSGTYSWIWGKFLIWTGNKQNMLVGQSLWSAVVPHRRNVRNTVYLQSVAKLLITKMRKVPWPCLTWPGAAVLAVITHLSLW